MSILMRKAAFFPSVSSNYLRITCVISIEYILMFYYSPGVYMWMLMYHALVRAVNIMLGLFRRFVISVLDVILKRVFVSIIRIRTRFAL